MDIGVFFFATEYSIRVDELAAALEERGLESLFLCEHTHIPTNRASPFPGGGELPREYAHTYDPFVALSFAAGVTTRLKLGTGICLVPQRDPIVTAKSVASVDRLSNGRFVFGIGGGWNAEEMKNHGADYKTRFKSMRERVLAMKALWTEDEPAFHGDFVNFDPVWCHPKPVQDPHPPILLGGESDHTLRRIVEYCDGWFPRGPRFDAKTDMLRLHATAEAAGRDPEELSVHVFRPEPEKGALDSLRAAGVARAILGVPSEPRDSVLPLLDRYAKLS